MPPRRTILGAAALAPFATAARAETWPARPIRTVIGFVAGGGADITLRILVAPRLVRPARPARRGGQPTRRRRQPLERDRATRRARRLHAAGRHHRPDDGEPGAVEGHARPGRGIRADLAAGAGDQPARGARPTAPGRSVAELVAAARAKPGGLSYGSSSVGSAGHLAAAVLDQAAGVETVHIPYRGGAADHRPDHRQGRFRLRHRGDHLAACADRPAAGAGGCRPRGAPPCCRTVPTIAESGVPGFDVVNWYGLAAPRATPARSLPRCRPRWRRRCATPRCCWEIPPSRASSRCPARSNSAPSCGPRRCVGRAVRAAGIASE